MALPQYKKLCRQIRFFKHEIGSELRKKIDRKKILVLGAVMTIFRYLFTFLQKQKSRSQNMEKVKRVHIVILPCHASRLRYLA